LDHWKELSKGRVESNVKKIGIFGLFFDKVEDSI
jgi:hypothetical protein